VAHFQHIADYYLHLILQMEESGSSRGWRRISEALYEYRLASRSMKFAALFPRSE